MATKKLEKDLLDIVQAAADQYGADNIGVAIDDESDEFYVYFHSDSNGYPVAETEILADDVDRDYVTERLDKMNVGYDF